jgi:hypothetical protein
MPLQDKITAYGKGGMTFWEYDVKGTSLFNNGELDGSDLFLGAGVEYPLQNNLNLRGGIDLYLGDFDDTRINAGITYRVK